MARVPIDGLNDVLFPSEVPNFQFRVEGRRGGIYEVTVYKEQIVIKKLSTGNIRTGTYEFVDFKVFLKGEWIVRRPVITLNFEADRHFPPSLLEKIKEIIEERTTDKYDVVSFVMNNLPEEWEAINRDPIKWVLKKSGSHFIGGAKYKMAVLHSLVSSRIEDEEMRANLLIVGRPGVGKSTLVKSVLDLLPEADWIHRVSKLTPEVLAYLDVKNIDGHILWVEEMDHLEYFRNLKKMLTEKVFTTWSTMKDKDGRLVKQEVRIEGIPLFMSTTVGLKQWESETEQILTRMLVFFLRQDLHKSKRYTLVKKKGDYPLSWKLVFYAWLWTRRTAKLTKEVINAIDKDLDKIVDKAKEAIHRMSILYSQLTIAHAMIYGRRKTTLEDFQFVKKHFAPELYLNSLLLNEQDIILMKALKELGNARASEIAARINETKSEAARMLRILTEKGVVEYDVDGDRKIYKLTPLGEEILRLLEAEEEEEEEEVEGEKAEEVDNEEKAEEKEAGVDEGEAKDEEVDGGKEEVEEKVEVEEKKEVEEVDQADEEKEEVGKEGGEEDVLFWRKHIYERFGFNDFTLEELAESIGVAKAVKLLRRLGEAGVVEGEGGKWRLRRIGEE